MAINTDINLINVFLNGGVVITSLSITGYFLNKWIKDTAIAVKETADKLSMVTEQHSRDLAQVTEKNREEVKNTTKGIVNSIDKLADQVRIANGRTGKIETGLAVQLALCQERTSKASCEAGK
jgi:hypothetical protein